MAAPEPLTKVQREVVYALRGGRTPTDIARSWPGGPVSRTRVYDVIGTLRRRGVLRGELPTAARWIEQHPPDPALNPYPRDARVIRLDTGEGHTLDVQAVLLARWDGYPRRLPEDLPHEMVVVVRDWAAGAVWSWVVDRRVRPSVSATRAQLSVGRGLDASLRLSNKNWPAELVADLTLCIALVLDQEAIFDDGLVLAVDQG